MQAMRWIPTTTVLGLALLAGACGGGDKNPTGPDGGSGLGGTYTLVGINEDGLPEDEPMEWGTASFQSGSLRLSQDGEWEMSIRYDHVERNEALTLEDFGQYGRQGDDLSFASEAFGDRFGGGVDEGFVYLVYDFDGNGDYETELTFER